MNHFYLTRYLFNVIESSDFVIIGASSDISAGLSCYLSNETKTHFDKLGLILVACRENEFIHMIYTTQNNSCHSS